MCFSSDVFERQASMISEKIIKNSIYKPVSLDFIGEKNVGIQDYKFQENGGTLPLITRIILEDNAGSPISIEPNENGLMYAMGEISYKEYKKIQNKDSRQFIGYFVTILSAFILVSWVSMRWFLYKLF